MAREKRYGSTSDSEEQREREENAEQKESKDSSREKEKKERRKLPPDSVLHQVIPILWLLLCAFFGICIYSNISVGILGNAVQKVCLGLFGCGAYFMPPLFLLWAIRWRRAAESERLGREMPFGVVILILISVLWYTFGVPADKMGAGDAFYAMGVARQGGGFVGNWIGYGLVALVSKVGTALIAVFAILLLGVLVLGFRYRDIALYLAAKARKRRAEKREAAMRKEEEQAEREAEEKKSRFRGDATLYTTTERLAGEREPRKENSGEATGHNAFLMPSGRTNARPTVRRLFDVEAEEHLIGNGQPAHAVETTAQVTPVAPVYDDDFLFDDTTPQGKPSMTSGRVSRAEDAYREEENGTLAQTELEAVEEDMGIPDIPAYRLGIEEENEVGTPVVSTTVIGAKEEVILDEVAEEASETEEAPQTIAVEDLSMTAEEEKAEEGDVADNDGAFVINKAHVIEHIGAETLGGGEHVFSGRQDTFFHSFPPLSLLQEDTQVSQEDSDQEIKEKSDKLMETLANYGVGAQKSCASRGPRLTRYELIPNKGVRIRAIESLVDEIAMNLEAVSVRIEAPIPGKAAVGVEVPNVKYSSVRLRGLLDTDTFRDAPGKTTVCLGVDVVGVPVFADLEKMPHLLVAGATGMGKSVCINSILVSLLYKARPDEIKLILIDPKKVEFKSYASIPHLLVPVVTEAQKAAGALSWAVNEMERRYDIIERVGVRSIKAYNKTLADHPEREPLPQIVIVIDELHDLMIQAKDAVEDSIARIAAKARAAGIILIIGTQRPSVNVITGVIKANIPSRIAFHVASQIDSRTILDARGAEKLLNNGDMLFLCPGMQMMSPKRVQGAFLDDDEVNRVAEYLRKNSAGVQYNEAVMADMDRESEKYNKDKKQGGDFPMGEASGDVGSEEE
ncbi:MAG: DNA translocase FtsK 4TM domain-containing protein, partial [Clostridia bacterium]|nr:DNA translocase FtsK 4TM domain-containing protein [Clostridia bacterium]